MAKKQARPKRRTAADLKRGESPTVKDGSNRPVTRERVNSLRGKFKGKGLLKTLMAEKIKERAL